jgi:hypothetical protein
VIDSLKMTGRSHWKLGAREEIDTIGKPEALTAKDWKRPATAWIPGGKESTADKPMFRTLKEAHSIELK